MPEYLFLEPIDVLYLRGNRLFGGPGQHGEALMPPWPSLAAGAIRSRILVDHKVDLAAYASVQAIKPDGPVGEALGTPSDPGSFRICSFMLGRRVGTRIEPCFPAPADLAVDRTSGACLYAHPTRVADPLHTSHPLERLPILKTDAPFKPESSLWLTPEGLRVYLQGDDLKRDHFLRAGDLWQSDNRLGIAMDPGRRAAEQGRIYTSETVALKEGTGFIVGVDGSKGILPTSGLLRFGGDGRAVTISPAQVTLPEPPWESIFTTQRFRLILSTPGLFPGGWLPPGTTKAGDGYTWTYRGCKARLVAAAVARSEVVSGWDLATRRPKPALRAVPVGSVYWFEGLGGTTADLKSLPQEGLWMQDIPQDYRQRRAEGFNNVLLASWCQAD